MNKKICRFLSAATALVLPSYLACKILNLLGHKLASDCRLGFSLVLTDRLFMKSGARIGHLNLININRLLMRKDAYVGRTNIINGPIDIVLNEKVAIGNRNKIIRAPLGVTSGKATLRLGKLAKITANHLIDCTQSIHIGHYSTIAGMGTQIWSHGYIHETSGPDRYRIDGKVRIGDNVYIGASCIISMGVNIVDGVIVGAGATVARDLDEAGLYVSSALRKLPRPLAPDARSDLIKSTDKKLCERVYLKKKL
jgi:acetyltransferase-like isoleucine patch superfamily enzyme